ncbi:hypothetical protein FDP41_006305 [Naegleria fowleri]|uniref:Uncharacterized protein n=1 Tax=Naegleria fowleri TaxID=5763 RepID=A0A6A5BKE1_NAEFO|nr:uncharacterized protein FDP41_006305 [Naegleria fowleri]KAF0974831.1 hypothetical protein FDP41_006305 [Naegleria fowleri]
MDEFKLERGGASLNPPQTSSSDYNEEVVSVSVRRATPKDFSIIQKFLNDNSFLLAKRFGNYNLKSVLETSYLSIIAETDNNQIIGFVSLEFDCISDPVEFEKYFSNLPLSVRNSIWIRLLHFEPFYGEHVLLEMLSSIFITFPEVDYICYHPGKNMAGVDFFSEFSIFSKEEAKDVKSENEKFVFLCHRDSLGKGVKKLSIRQAVVEDNDDIVPILSCCENITSMKPSGEYFFANLLYEQNEHRKVLIATNDEGEIIGVMYLSAEVDVRQIITDYKLQSEDVPIYDEFINETQYEDQVIYNANAFEIKLFYIQEEYKFRSIDFLREAFKYFSNIKYCIVGINFEDHTKSEHPLLKQFIFVEPNQECSSYSLHLLPKVSLMADFLVVKATETSLDKNSSPEETILNLLRLAEFDDEFISAVAKSFKGTRYVTMLLFDKNSAIGGQNEIIGIAVVDTQVNEFLLRRHFDFTEYVDYSAYSSRGKCQGMITHYYIEQKFFRYSKLFLKEVMKKLDKHILYYGCYRGEVPNESLNKELIYLKSTRQIEFPEFHSETNGRHSAADNETVVTAATTTTVSSGGSRIQTNVQYDSLYFINRRFLSEEKTEIFSRIVVIGGSKTGLGFIKELSVNSSLYFNNIIVVSPATVDGNCSHFYTDDTDEEFSNRELQNMISLPNIFFVRDKLEDIDRHNKRVILNDNSSSFITYDILILCTSRQYKMKQKYLELQGYPKRGVLNLNSAVLNEQGEEMALTDYLSTFFVKNDDRYREENSYIVVYGSSLDALCTARALLDNYEIDPEKILLVFPDGKKGVFNENDTLEEKIDSVLEVVGLKSLMFYHLEDMASDDDGNLIKIYLAQGVEAEKEDARLKNSKLLELDCSLFINCHSKDVDDGILSTVNRQSLVFDGRLIVDTQFRTTDPSIYSAGPMAKFSRRFGESRMMEAFNSSEVGAKLARSVLHSLGVGDDEFQPDVMPTFTKNTSVRCILPGGVRFFRCMTSTFDVEKCLKFETSCNTGSAPLQQCMDSFRYCCIYVDKSTNCIECICYLGQELVEEGNLASLVGLPVSYFNDLVNRYQEDLITDFIDFLRENWVMAILCHKFMSFKNDVKKKLLNEETLIGNIYDVCSEMAEKLLKGEVENLTIDPSLFINLEKKVSRDAKILVQSELIDFLSVHQDILHSIPSVYYVPKN